MVLEIYLAGFQRKEAFRKVEKLLKLNLAKFLFN